MKTAQRLYDWERNVVEPRAVGFLSREDSRSLVARAAAASGIPVPGLRFVKSSSAPCMAEPGLWRISVSDWGRTPVTLLHEVAHLATLEAILAGEDPHGPAFLGHAMWLYSTVLGVDRGRMEVTAAAAGLAFTRPGERPPRAGVARQRMREKEFPDF